MNQEKTFIEHRPDDAIGGAPHLGCSADRLG
jgi:hypothetical protein